MDFKTFLNCQFLNLHLVTLILFHHIKSANSRCIKSINSQIFNTIFLEFFVLKMVNFNFSFLLVISLFINLNSIFADKFSRRIYNGEDAKVHQFPFIVFISTVDGMVTCTGSLISHKLVEDFWVIFWKKLNFWNSEFKIKSY